MARLRLSATVSMSRAKLATAYWRASAISRSVRRRRFSISASVRKQPVLEVGDLGAQRRGIASRSRRGVRGRLWPRSLGRAWSGFVGHHPLSRSMFRVARPDIRVRAGKIKRCAAKPRLQIRRSATCSIQWLAPLLRIRSARGRVGRMFSRRLTRLIRFQRPSAIATASSSLKRGVAVEIGCRVAEGGLAQAQEALDVPAADDRLVGVDDRSRNRRSRRRTERRGRRAAAARSAARSAPRR